ncbi:hypothetical protein P7C70_g2055, partial [Phenoliferia sp. Uapishka_3]
MLAYLAAPRDPEEYTHVYERANYVRRMLSPNDPFLPNSVRCAFGVFARQYGLVGWELVKILNDSVRAGHIGARIQQPPRQWNSDDVEFMLDQHDFPTRLATEDSHVNNVIILNGLARLYCETDASLEMYLCSWAERASCFTTNPWRSQADYAHFWTPSPSDFSPDGMLFPASDYLSTHSPTVDIVDEILLWDRCGLAAPNSEGYFAGLDVKPSLTLTPEKDDCPSEDEDISDNSNEEDREVELMLVPGRKRVVITSSRVLRSGATEGKRGTRSSKALGPRLSYCQFR